MTIPLPRLRLQPPDIAGYSFDGKINGTRMIYEAACAFFGIKPRFPKQTPSASTHAITLDMRGSADPVAAGNRQTPDYGR